MSNQLRSIARETKKYPHLRAAALKKLKEKAAKKV